ncbi:hypothetical protein C8R44DRAFT_726803 [Mycena epipterygia]|nr:hypothetical protein C8R44DRAFT_726803 [Mycena epipterygia]
MFAWLKIRLREAAVRLLDAACETLVPGFLFPGPDLISLAASEKVVSTKKFRIGAKLNDRWARNVVIILLFDAAVPFAERNGADTAAVRWPGQAERMSGGNKYSRQTLDLSRGKLARLMGINESKLNRARDKSVLRSDLAPTLPSKEEKRETGIRLTFISAAYPHAHWSIQTSNLIQVKAAENANPEKLCKIMYLPYGNGATTPDLSSKENPKWAEYSLGIRGWLSAVV